MVAVVGASGFLGGALANAAARGGHDVATFSRQHPAIVDGVVANGLASAKAIVWTASRVTPKTAEERPDWVQADFDDLDDVLTALERQGSRARVLLASSGGTVYADGAPPHRETDPLTAIGAYARAKLAMEERLQRSPLGTTSMRISNVYGPGQWPKAGQGVVAHWLEAVAGGRALTLFGDPHLERDYVFIDDLAEAALRILEAPAVDVINVGSGRPTSLADVLDAVRAAVDPLPVAVQTEAGRHFDRPSTWLAVERLETITGWRPCTTIEAGVAAQWAWWREQRSIGA